MIQIRQEQTGDVVAREQLLDACFGTARFLKTSERLREGRHPAHGLSLTAERQNRVVGTVRLWHVEAGLDRPALLLGPLAVDPSLQGHGLGGTLMRTVLRLAEDLGHGAVLLVGDAPYYMRFGFSTSLTEGLWMPGPVDRERFLGLNLRKGALDGAAGILRATGDMVDLNPVAGAVLQGADARRRAA